MKTAWLACALALAGCGDDSGGAGPVDALDPGGADAPVSIDASHPATDASTIGDGAPATDGAQPDAASVPDATPPIPDAAPPTPDATTELVDHVHIDVSNTCVMSVSPTSYDVQPGHTLQLSYHNHSDDYAVDVWKSYGGGYLDLATGGTWNEQYVHCTLQSTYTEYADISTACSSFRLYINCL